MFRSRALRVTALVASAVVVLVVLASGAEARAQPTGSPDSEMYEIAQRYPTFAGAWVSGDAVAGEAEVLHVWLLDGDEQELPAIRVALVDMLGERFAADDLVTHRADYDLTSLFEWKAVATGLVAHGVTYVAFDETVNRISVGLDPYEGVREAVEAELASQGAPLEAFTWSEARIEQVPGPADAGRSALPSARVLVVATLVAVVAAVVGLRRTRSTAPSTFR